MFVSKCKESPHNTLQAWRKDLQENLSEEKWLEAVTVSASQTLPSPDSKHMLAQHWYLLAVLEVQIPTLNQRHTNDGHSTDSKLNVDLWSGLVASSPPLVNSCCNVG